MMDLMKDARPDEQFHLQTEEPLWRMPINLGIVMRLTRWTHLTTRDGSPTSFWSLWFWRLQIYWGGAKCDGSRTYRLNRGDLGDPTPGYVMTTTPKELLAFRWRSSVPVVPSWDNMGGT